MVSRLAPTLLLLVPLLFGCTPRVTVVQNPAPGAKGIRYFRPKPYLKIAPYEEVVQDGKTVVRRNLVDHLVTIELEYLPDFSEEYAIRVRPGMGSVNAEITLEDGWKLTQLNTEMDTQLDEVISSVADLVGAVAPEGLVGPPARTAPDAGGQGTGKQVVRATNVPLGYYEAILGTAPDGRKRLYGWRYVGFVPYAMCPIDGCGATGLSCEALDLYGLVFENGVMTFRPLYQVQTVGDDRYRVVWQNTNTDAMIERLPPIDSQ